MPPKVSVIMATYNHAPYVSEAIESVLSQDFANFEFIIADDGSTDDTAKVIASIDDPRITFYPHRINRGACEVTNELIGRCRGTYIALLNSDDRWTAGKLARQVAFLEKNKKIGAIFGRAQFIDKTGEPIPHGNLPFGDIFVQANRTRGEWLRRFFDSGNCLCHPSILVRRKVYEALGTFDNCYRQLPDLDMWIRMVKHVDIHVAESCDVEFRIVPGENVSHSSKHNSIRCINELYSIIRTFFDDVSPCLLKQGFHDRLQFKHIPSDEHLQIEKALLYRHELHGLDKIYSLVALEKLRALLHEESTRRVLLKEYRISDRVYQAWSARIDTLRPDWPEDPPPAPSAPAVPPDHPDQPHASPAPGNTSANGQHYERVDRSDGIGNGAVMNGHLVSETKTVRLAQEVARRLRVRLREAVRR